MGCCGTKWAIAHRALLFIFEIYFLNNIFFGLFIFIILQVLKKSTERKIGIFDPITLKEALLKVKSGIP